MFPLEIFPPSGLSTSVITCVWVGVFVVAFFNLRFGWVLTGLVVPGYIVPLLLLKPWSAFAIFIEGAVTYFVVWFFSERLSILGVWSRLFGRDRFFALIVASIAVRLLFDAGVFPWAGDLLNTHYGIEFDYVNDLHSLGLIVVSLIANNFWRSGFTRGSMMLVTTVGITYLIVRYGFMEFTNFHITDLQYAYEDLASSILASPKAYIILVSTALIASRMNLFYGWEYNGILMPSLIALQWYQPLKVATSFVEAFVILGLASLVLRLPMFANASIEGARKLLLFFNIGFFYKWLLSLVVIYFWPDFKVSDTFAFGYLLSTLMAIKMHDKEIIGVLTRATLQTSLTALVVATLVGFALTYAPSIDQLFGVDTAARQYAVSAQPLPGDLDAALGQATVGLYARHGDAGVPAPTRLQLAAFEEGIRAVGRLPVHGPRERLSDALPALNRGAFTARWVEDRYIYLEPSARFPGRGIYVVDTQANNDLLIEAPMAADERRTLDAAAWLFRKSGARVLAVAGTYRDTNADRSMDILRERQTHFSVVHRVFARDGVVQVRGYPEDTQRAQGGKASPEFAAAKAANRSSLWVTGSVSGHLDLAALERGIGGFDIHWQSAPVRNVLRETTLRDFAELFLTADDRRSIVARALDPKTTPQLQIRTQRIDGYIQDWLLGGKERLARRGTDLYRPPTVEELLYLDEEVFTPVVRAARDGIPDDDSFNVIGAAAAVLGYQIVRYRHKRSGVEYLIVQEREDPQTRYWGTLVLRIGPAQNYLIQVPRPIYEHNSFEYAVSLFEQLGARALIIAGAHPLANRDGQADLIRFENVSNAFNLATQVLLREMKEDEPALVLHSRAFGLRVDGVQPDEDVIVAFSDGFRKPDLLPPLGARLLQALRLNGLGYRIADGSPAMAGYEVGGLPPSLYPATMPGKHFGILWLSPFAREEFRQDTDNSPLDNQFRALDIGSSRADLVGLLEQRMFADIRDQVFGELKSLIRRYVDYADIVSLYRLKSIDSELDYERVIDINSRQAYLLVTDRRSRVVAVANLKPGQPDQEISVIDNGGVSAAAQRFLEARAGWLRYDRS